MAVRIINRNIIHLKEVIYGAHKSKHRGLHGSFKLDKNVQFCLSDIGEGIREVTVKSWHVKPEDKVAQFDNICEVESDKATVTITSRYDGVIKKLYYDIDDTAFVGKPLVDIEVPDERTESGGVSGADNPVKTVDDQNSSEQTKELSDDVVVSEKSSYIPTVNSFINSDSTSEPIWDKSCATPAVRRIAMENNIKICDVKATGKNNRVLKEDIINHLNNLNKPNTLPDKQKFDVKPVTRIMKTMIKTMTESNSIPKFGYSDNIDFSRLVEMKSRLSQSNNIKITYLPFILKAISKSLFEFPILNSSLDKDFKHIVYKSYHNIGIAVDSPSGLLVPNIKNVERLSIIDISKEIKRLQKSALDNTLTPNELNDGTFSVSNIGAVGGVQGLPCILPPEVVIVAVGRVQKVPRFDQENKVVPAYIVNFTFTADHRIIDGATVARFSNMIKSYLENPDLLLIELE